ncbi:hypothetical protein TNCV_3588481 [Trichonephila clavipes]|nr:hypothetical protein TNCV_3588481 [Trichonephila clavipes]
MSSRKTMGAAVAQWSGYRIVAGLVTNSSPVPLKTRRVGQRCTLNLSRAQTSSRCPAWEKLLRLPDGLFLLSKLHLNSVRRSKTQRGFVQGVLELKEQLDLDFVPEPLVSSLDPTIDEGFRICTELSQAVSKKEQNTSILRSLALETIDTTYPEPDWVHIYTDGSLLKDSDSAGAGVYCRFFSFYLTTEKFTAAFNDEVAAL